MGIAALLPAAIAILRVHHLHVVGRSKPALLLWRNSERVIVAATPAAQPAIGTGSRMGFCSGAKKNATH